MIKNCMHELVINDWFRYFGARDVASFWVAGMSSFSVSFEIIFLLASSLLATVLNTPSALLPELNARLKPVLEFPLGAPPGEVLKTPSPGAVTGNIVAGVGGKLLIGESMKQPRTREVSLECQF